MNIATHIKKITFKKGTEQPRRPVQDDPLGRLLLEPIVVVMFLVLSLLDIMGTLDFDMRARGYQSTLWREWWTEEKPILEIYQEFRGGFFK
jgi:hypothetical protein